MVVGSTASLVMCAVFWGLLAALVIHMTDFHPLSYLSLIYHLFLTALLTSRNLKIERLYRCLPYVNTSLGGLLFVALTISKAGTPLF